MKLSGTAFRLPMPLRRRTAGASCTGISSRRTCFFARSGGPSGQPIAKLLDFGIAKAIDPSAAAGADQATFSEEGTLLGTCSTWRPSSSKVRAAHTRSDLFAFGAVLYKMLTGRRAFGGESPSKIIAAVLDSEPLPLVEAPLAPPLLAHVVMTCLAKNRTSAGKARRT